MKQLINDQAAFAPPSAATSERKASSMAVDLLLLMKPRVLSLLLVSTCCPMVLASGGKVSLSAVCWALIGGALVSGSASALNCLYERDIDALMERTKNRPLPAGRLTPTSALIFSLLVGALGVGVLAYFLNWLAAGIALAGHLFYVLVYTMMLKRVTPQNIVIGGAAGAVPPLVGWAAVTGEVSLTAGLLFLLIFLWTPPHFWALALNKNSDYQKAGIPMLPVVAGERATHNQMLIYSLLLIPISVLLVITNDYLGAWSLVTLLILSLIFSFKVAQLRSMIQSPIEIKTKKAWDVFGFSLIYLALFFVCIVVDSTFV